MWPDLILSSIGPLLLKKLSTNYTNYILEKVKPVWYAKLGHITNLLDFRDYVEDTLQQLHIEMSVEHDFDITELLCTLKEKPTERRQESLKFLVDNALKLSNHVTVFTKSKQFIGFCLDVELDRYFKASKELTFRPLLKVQPSVIESVVKEIELLGSLISIKDLERFQGLLQASSLWTPLALLKANHQGDLEDIFLNVPMPKVFGQPNSFIRSELDRKCNFELIARQSKKKLDFQKIVLLSNESISWLSKKEFITRPLKAHKIVNLPGLKDHVWTLNTETLEATILCLEPYKKIIEFELPKDDLTNNASYFIDCQRDSEGALILIWGLMNSITGSAIFENMVALDEASLFSTEPKIEFLQEISEVPDRKVPKARMDWRDHANLLSVNHTVKDDAVEGDRHWTHTYEIVFGPSLLMSMSTDSRPIEAVYGNPHDIVLLSPLSSSRALQHWSLKDNAYVLIDQREVPKDHIWTTFCICH